MVHAGGDGIDSDSQDYLTNFSFLLSAPEELGLARLRDDPACFEALLAICQSLYQRLDHLNGLYYQIQQKKVKPLSPYSPSSLIVVEEENDDMTGAQTQYHSAETLWSQIDLLQSSTLPSLLKKAIKDLGKAASNIQLLEPDISGDNGSRSDSDSELSDGEMNTKEKTRESDRQNTNIDHSDSSSSHSDNGVRTSSRTGDLANQSSLKVESDTRGGKSKSNGEDVDDDADRDPAVQLLNDGIFDFHEMESFADEEEAFLPDPAFGTEKPDLEPSIVDTRSFHQRQREGAISDGESSDEEASDDLARRTNVVRRRMYREDEDIEALYQLYENPATDRGDDDASATQLTASDLYGKPNPKYFHKWRNQKEVNSELLPDDDSSVEDNSDVDEKQSENAVSRRKKTSSDLNGSQDGKVLGKQDPKNGKDKSIDKLTRQTELLEQEMLAEKPWQMKGETTSVGRPVNSLLGATPDFEVASKLAPVVTIEHTESIEEMIKGRVLNEDWDDLIPRELPDIGWNAKRGELQEVSQEKSKLSLGELYEREFLKKAAGYDVDAAEKQTELDAAKSEMKTLFANLCSKLDALSNYHFAPRPLAEEADVRVVTKPAIAMEETLPIHVNEARASAPQDVYAGKRGREGILRDDSELDQIDRKRMRSAKKAARRKTRQEKLAGEKLLRRIQPGLGLNNPYEKRKVRQDLEAARARGVVTSGEADANAGYGDSGTFFKRLQDEAQRSVRGDSHDMAKSSPPRKSNMNFKL